MRGPRALTAAAVLVAALTSGCAAIPSDGPLQKASAGAGAQPTAEVRVLPPSPRKGAAPDSIVRGFLAAGAAFENDHAIARRYLTTASRATWRPSEQVIVHTGPYVLSTPPGGVAGSATRFKVQAAQTAAVDEHGAYARLRRDRTLDLALVKEDGEWRIDAPPDGVLLAATDVARVFRLRDVFFLDSQQAVVIADLVLMPEQRDLADALVRRLVAGPSQAIAAAVRTAVTDGMRLATPVSVDDRGVATVELAGVAPATEEAREALSAQVVWTLRQLPEVRDIRIRVGGRPLEAGSAAEVLARDAWPQYDPAVLASDAEAYALRANKLGLLAGTSHAPLANAAGTGERPLSQFAVSIDRTTLAGLSGGRLYVGPLDGSRPMAAVTAPEGRLAEPSFDRVGTLWVLEQTSGIAYAVGSGDGDARQLLTSGLDARVTALHVARDGVRVALLTRAGTSTSLWVGVITRPTGGPFVAEALRLVSSFPEPLVDLAWQDHKRVVLLPSEQGRSPYVIDIAGFDEELLPPLPVDARSITAGPGLALPALVGTDRDSILRLEPRRWSAEFAGSEPSYPG